MQAFGTKSARCAAGALPWRYLGDRASMVFHRDADDLNFAQDFGIAPKNIQNFVPVRCH